MKTNRKFELTDETFTFPSGLVLRRIRALRDIKRHCVNKGDLGGFVESEKNLSQVGQSWVGGEAKVYGSAWVYGKCLISKSAKVFGDARVHGNAWIHGKAKVYGEARVSQKARVRDTAHIYDYAQVKGHALVSGVTKISGNSVVLDGDQILNKDEQASCAAEGENPTAIQHSVLEVNLLADLPEQEADTLLEALVERSVVRREFNASQERLVQLRKVINSFK